MIFKIEIRSFYGGPSKTFLVPKSLKAQSYIFNKNQVLKLGLKISRINYH
jgi:hypothetical protein